jgi:hypothetical protein
MPPLSAGVPEPQRADPVAGSAVPWAIKSSIIPSGNPDGASSWSVRRSSRKSPVAAGIPACGLGRESNALDAAFRTGKEAPGPLSVRWRAADDFTVISMFPVRRDSANSRHAS